MEIHAPFSRVALAGSKLNRDVLVVLSGGQDSATALLLAHESRQDGAKVSAISFDYGQRHRIELLCAANQAADLNIGHKTVDARALAQVGVSALSGSLDDVNAEHPHLPGRPASFVPNRNAFFLTLAHAYAISIGAGEIWTGVCQTDYSGYPDCRREFIDRLEQTLYLGSEVFVPIITPMMRLNKAQTWQLANEVREDGVEWIAAETHTCYNGDHEHIHEWGYGCGECGACKLRKQGYEKFMAGDMS